MIASALCKTRGTYNYVVLSEGTSETSKTIQRKESKTEIFTNVPPTSESLNLGVDHHVKFCKRKPFHYRRPL